MKARPIGLERGRIAALLTGDQLAEMLALAEFQVGVGAMLTFNMSHTKGVIAELIDLKVVAAEGRYSRGVRKVRITELGWLALLDRCRAEMAAILPPETEKDEAE